MQTTIGEYRDVSVCAIPHRMTIVEGGVLFSDKSGLARYATRHMFSYREHLWYLEQDAAACKAVAACHLVEMYKLLQDYIGPDHSDANGSNFVLTFKK